MGLVMIIFWVNMLDNCKLRIRNFDYFLFTVFYLLWYDIII